MAHTEYLPTTFEGDLVRLMEECAEVQKCAAKLLRFGNRVWGDNLSNAELLEDEMSDLKAQIARVRTRYATTMGCDFRGIGSRPIWTNTEADHAE